MDALLDIVSSLVSDNTTLLMLAAAALPLTGVVFLVRHLRKVKQDVQRRVMADPGTFATTQLGATARVAKRAARVVESMAEMAGSGEMDTKQAKALRARLIQAGYYDKQAVGIYFGLRFITGFLGAALAAAFFFFYFGFDPVERTAVFSAFAGLAGYFLPTIILNRKIERAQIEHTIGFPDYMDLMVVCAQAGLSMEAGIAKIAAELRTSYPSLARNLELANIEIRSGKTLSQSIDGFGKRLGIEEAKAFATLLAQSEELGSSLSQSLRAYSDDMRNKRLMKAEEKAFSLPAKLVVPLTLFVFPSLLVVLLLPVVVSVSQSAF